MGSIYHPKYLPDGTLNPRYKARSSQWKKQPSGKRTKPRPNPGREFFNSLPQSKGKKRTALKDYQFRAFDGEGAEINNRHEYILLNNSDKECIYDVNGLDHEECFEYLLDCHERDPKRINVVFAGGYDANLWLRGLSKDEILRINEADGKYYVRTDCGKYEIRFVQRKYFAIKRPKQKSAFLIWDVFGFFQCAFLSAMKQWLPNSPLYDLIAEGKKRRTSFDANDIHFIKKYCDAELVALVQMMEILRNALLELDLKITRWDGAGAIAAAMFKQEKVKDHLRELPADVQLAAQHAYFGGRIEIGKYGHHEGTIHNYDINSAYPWAQSSLPSLAHGRWIERGEGYDPRNSDSKMIVCLIEWSGFDDNVFCPFPYRSEAQNKVLFPAAGVNWIWKPEVVSALNVKERTLNAQWKIKILSAWEFVASSDIKPFKFLEEKYEYRKQIIEETRRTGIFNGVEKPIKLGCNSAYGKTAQKSGYNTDTKRKPPYHNIAYAGIITSATRARLWEASQQCEDKIIALATDGIYSQAPLKLNTPKEKILGEWEYSTYDSMTLVQAGFYWLREGEKLTSYSRGFDKMTDQKGMAEVLAKVKNAWQDKQGEIYLPCTRFITLKSALRGENWWPLWCTWHKMVSANGIEGRRLTITPHGTKRRIKSGAYGKPHIKMCDTLPQINITPDIMSSLYTLPWDEDVNDTAIDIEHSDSYL